MVAYARGYAKFGQEIMTGCDSPQIGTKVAAIYSGRPLVEIVE